MDSGPIAIINDVNIFSQIKIFTGKDKSAKTTKILPCEAIGIVILYTVLSF